MGLTAYKISRITVSPATASGSQVVTLTINNGRYLKGGHYFLDIRSVSPTNLTGIQDVYGNALDGEFYDFFPSGNNVPGGDFIAELDAVHHTIYAAFDRDRHRVARGSSRHGAVQHDDPDC